MQSIQTLMQALERSPEWQANAGLRRVLAQWPQLVGAAVAQHSRPTNVHRQTLQVSVSSAAWSQTLTFERSRILQKLHKALPETETTILELRFTAANWHQFQRSPTPRVPLLSQHPSWADWSAPSASVPLPTASTAFQYWAERKRRQLAKQQKCPRCQSPCPSQEVVRWGVCSICIAHQWYKPQTQNRQC